MTVHALKADHQNNTQHLTDLIAGLAQLTHNKAKVTVKSTASHNKCVDYQRSISRTEQSLQAEELRSTPQTEMAQTAPVFTVCDLCIVRGDYVRQTHLILWKKKNSKLTCAAAAPEGTVSVIQMRVKPAPSYCCPLVCLQWCGSVACLILYLTQCCEQTFVFSRTAICCFFTLTFKTPIYKPLPAPVTVIQSQCAAITAIAHIHQSASITQQGKASAIRHTRWNSVLTGERGVRKAEWLISNVNCISALLVAAQTHSVQHMQTKLST